MRDDQRHDETGTEQPEILTGAAEPTTDEQQDADVNADAFDEDNSATEGDTPER
jgi:hypothetical protein